MAHSSTHLLVFGDQVIDKRPMIRRLVRNSKSSAAARRFLQEATDVVQVELAQLTPDEHGWPGSFESLLTLAEEHADREEKNTAVFFISSLLASIGRLGDLIVLAEQDPTILGSKERPIHVLALCAGQVPAAAAVAARDTSELFAIARDIISASCRWMRVVHWNRMAMISPTQYGGWSVTFPRFSAARMQVILDDFHATKNVPTMHQIAIGVIATSWLTIVGPPSSLRRLTEFSATLREAPQIAADAGVPAHAPFMLGVDPSDLVPCSPMLDRSIDWEKVTMVSPGGDCRPRRLGTLRDLLCDIFEDILMRTLLVDKTVIESITQIDSDTTVNVHEIGDTTYMPLILKTLTSAGLSYVVVPACQAALLGSVHTRGMSDLVAIVGMAGRFPGSDNVNDFWEDLVSGACHIKKVPKSRYDVDRYYDPTQKLKNSTASKDGAWLNDPGLFDNRFFNVSPREAVSMDPVQRLFLTTAHEALEMAGYAPGVSPSMEPERVASFFGVTGSDWPEIVHQQGVDIYYVTGGARAFVSGKLNYHYKFGRGSYTVDSVCASSTTAIVLACKGLISRDCDMAVVGGGSIFSAPFDLAGLSKSGMVSSAGGCRTFHDDADGYARGEGVGTVIVKRLEDALADRDNVLGVISGATRTYSTTSMSITHPSHKSQEKVFREVLGQNALNPKEIVYVEMHGTGTQAGDLEELTSILNVMGTERDASNPLVLGAVKAAVGHGEGVAGITSLIKTLLMLKHRKIPAQPGVPFKVNHRFPDLEKRNVHIAMASMPLLASPQSLDGKARMLINTFDASGGNCSLVVQEAPDTGWNAELQPPDVRTSHVVALSARFASSLQRNCENLAKYLENNQSVRLCDLAYTTTARRMHFTLRKAFVCSSTDDCMLQLRRESTREPRKRSPTRVVFLCTGQGSHYQAMGMNLFKTCRRFQELISTYQSIASRHDLPDFLPIISGSMDITNASTVQTQLAVVALELGVAHMLRVWGIVPSAVIGHSLGEYAAMCIAGVLSPSEALYLVGRRAKLLEQRLEPNSHAMLAVPIAAEELTARLKKSRKIGHFPSCEIACINSPAATVVSGTLSDVQNLRETLAGQSLRSTLLNIPFSFHSAQIEPILEEFEHISGGIVFKKPIIPVASTLIGQLVDDDGIFNPSYLVRQMRSPVNFVAALDAIATKGFTSDSTTLWMEIGPDATCLGMVGKTLKVDPANLLPALLPYKDSWATVANIMKTSYEHGLPIDWKAYHSESSVSLALLSDLPSYSWDYKNYWTTYTVPPSWESEQAVTIPLDSNSVPDQQAHNVANGFTPTVSLQKIVKETLDIPARTATMVFFSDTSAPDLRKVLECHVVSGHALMPLAVFCDMALTSVKYCHLRMVSNAGLEAKQMKLQNMTITKAVVLKATSSSVVLTTARYYGATESADITFHEQDKEGNHGALIGTCRVLISTVSAQPLVSDQQALFLVKNRMQQLRDLSALGNVHILLRPVVYRLFGDYVLYSTDSRSIDKAIVSTGSQDALAWLTAPDTDRAAASCAVDPPVYDGVNQLSGFLLNNSLRSEDNEIIHICEGFSESRQWESLVSGRKYVSYALGQDVDSSGTVVDVTSYVFDATGEQLVQMVTGMRFQKIKKSVLRHILGGSSDARSSEATPTPACPPSYTKESQLIETPAMTYTNASKDTSTMSHILAAIADEVGIGVEDMTDETLFADLGIDSLMAISILSSIGSKQRVMLPSTFFMEHGTVGEAKRALLMLLREQNSSGLADASASASRYIDTPVETEIVQPKDRPHRSSSLPELLSQQSKAISLPKCKVVQLQGASESLDTTPTIFFLADETGSSAGYVQLPSLGGLRVYGINWSTDSDIDNSNMLSSLVDSVVASIAGHPAQPPYILGGVNFGAVLAFEVARRMRTDDIAAMLLIDPPISAEDILRTRDRLARMRTLKPEIERRLEAAAEAVDKYQFKTENSNTISPVVLVVPESTERHQTWNERLPRAEIIQVDGAQAGALLRLPKVNATGQICQNAIDRVRK